MYSDESKSTSIAYRIIHENLPKYFDNIKVYDQIMATSISEQVAELDPVSQLESTIGTHAGPGTIVVAYFMRRAKA